MKSLEIERAVESMASECQTCKHLHVQIGQAHQDLNSAARIASRRTTEKNIAAAKKAKAELSRVREFALEHLAEH